MNKAKRLVALLLFLAISATAAFAAPSLDKEALNESREIWNGVIHTHIQTPTESRYGLQNVNIVEFDPSQADLQLNAVGGGEYANTLATVPDTVERFASENPELTPIAAINGDLWMVAYAHGRIEGSGTNYNGFSDPVVKGELTLPRGFNVYDGEIICSSYMYQETPYEGEFWSFGISADGRALIGCPTLEISLENNKTAVKADGLNRLPADNALVVYTDRGCLNNYALDDAYELLIRCDDPEYRITDGTTLRGEIVGVYDENTEENPVMSDGMIIITARGSTVDKIDHLAAGDRLAISFEVGERYGRDVEGWKSVTDAVGGHMPFVIDGIKNETGATTGYPSTIVGIKNDGKVILVANDGRQKELSRGFDFNDYAALTDELDINTGIILDGGGSTTMVVLDEEEYKVVNSPSDGSPRTVVNSLILSAGPDVEKSKTEVRIPAVNETPESIYFTDEGNIDRIIPNIQTRVSCTDEGALILADRYNGDGYVNICFGTPGSELNGGGIDIDEYPYIVLDMKPVTKDKGSVQFQTFYVNGGEYWGGSADTFCCFNNVLNTNQFSRYIIDTTANPNITGQLNTIRMGYLIAANGTTVTDGDGICLRSVRFARTAEEAAIMASHPFGDIRNDKWYSEAIGYCYSNGYMAGTSTLTFSHSAEVTRAMFATILSTLSKADLDEYTHSVFDDVDEGKWYTAPITWANANGLAEGMGDGRFAPGDPVTREQISLFLYKFAQFRGMNTSARADLSGFGDEDRIHAWAYDAVSWAVAEGLISGVSKNVLSPRTSSTRAQVAVMLMKFTRNVSPIEKEIDLIMFSGQSNMAGRGNGSLAPEVPLEAGAEFRAFSFPGALFPINEAHTPFGYNENNPSGINDISKTTGEPKKTGGIVPAFVNAYYEASSTPVVAVSASCGSSTSTGWTRANRGYYQDAINRFNTAAAWLEANGYTVKHRYLVWLQGESDAKNGLTAEEYIVNVNKIFNELLAPATGMEKCLMISIGHRLNNQDGVSYDYIIDAQNVLCRDYDNFVMISDILTTFTDAKYYKTNDPTHFRQEYMNEAGTDAGRNAGYFAQNGSLPELLD